jgi:hypothetical protein
METRKMSDRADVPVIGSPGDLIQLIPYLVGFTPQESLVVVVIQDDESRLTARADIADMTPPGAAEDLMDRIWRRYPDADAFLLAYTEDRTAGWELLRRCSAWLPAGAVREALVVDGDTWQLPDGSQGVVVSGRIAAEAARHGLHRLESRADLEARFASAPRSVELSRRVGEAEDMLPSAGESAAIVARVGRLLRDNLPNDEPSLHDALTQSPVNLTALGAIQLAILVRNPPATDLALLSITPENARAHLQLWRSVVNQVPNFGAEYPLFVAGMAAWVAGDGAVASIALERLEAATTTTVNLGQTDPQDMLRDLIDKVVPPSTWTEKRLGLLAKTDQRVRREIAIGQRPLDHRQPNTGRTPADPEPVRRRPTAPGLAL